MANGKRFHITIGASPESKYGEGISLGREVQLVKAAMLYGDEATLCSPTSVLLLGMASLGQLAADEMRSKQQFDSIAPMLQAASDTDMDAFSAGYHALLKQKRLTRDQLRLKLQIEAAVKKGWRTLRDKMFELAKQAGAEDLLTAVESGHLQIHPLNLADSTTDGSADDTTWAFVDALSDAVKDATTFPLLDDRSQGLLRSMIREGHIETTAASAQRGRHVALAASLLEQLPQFDLATMVEVVDIRRDLARHLDRFRAAMLTYSSQIVPAAWDAEFGAEAENVFLKNVAPAVRDIEDAVASSSYLRALTSRFIDRASGLAGPVLSIGLTQVPALSDVVGIAIGAASVAGNAYLAHQDHRDARLRAEQNQLFFYYAAGERLKA